MKQAAPDIRPLGMTESYHATQRWLSFIGEPTTRIEDPTDGVVQLYTEHYIVLIRVDREPASQSAVIAMMRAAVEIDDLTMLMFSPTGYNTSAVEFADLRRIPLFTLTSRGDAKAMTGAARAIVPSEPYEPPFSEPDEEEPPDPFDVVEPVPELETEDRFDLAQVEWKTCPRCNASQHPDLAQCAACGGDLNARLTLLGDSLRPPSPVTAPAQKARRPGASTLQCQNCGSHDIDLVHL